MAITLKHWPTQKAAKEAIQQAIDTNERAVYKALMLIYAQQTDSEQRVGMTTDLNNRGFGAFDAELMTSFAQSFQRYGRLTDKQLALCRKKVRCYWKQLMLLKEGKL